MSSPATPLELDCADATRPCLLEGSLVADPPLQQVVAHSYQAGARGNWGLGDGKLEWSVSLFRTAGRSDSDTLAHRLLASPGLDSAATIDNLDNGFVGVSVVASAWTWVQPASIGLRVDRAVAVVGDVVVSVELGGVDVKDGHGLLQQVARALHWS